MSFDPNHVVLQCARPVGQLSGAAGARARRQQRVIRPARRRNAGVHRRERMWQIDAQSGADPPASQERQYRQRQHHLHLPGRDGRSICWRSIQRDLRAFLWSECSMVFQGALNSLNPVIRICDMVYDTAAAHGMARSEARKRALKLFEQVRLDPERVFQSLSA